MEEDITEMRYADLRKYCKSLGLTAVGKKEYLIEIVREHLSKNNKNEVVVQTPVVENKVIQNVAESAKKTRGRQKKVVAQVPATAARVQSESPAPPPVKIQKTPEVQQPAQVVPAPQATKKAAIETTASKTPLKVAFYVSPPTTAAAVVESTTKRVQSESPVKKVILKNQKTPKVAFDVPSTKTTPAKISIAPTPKHKRTESASPVKRVIKAPKEAPPVIQQTPTRLQSESPVKKVTKGKRGRKKAAKTPSPVVNEATVSVVAAPPPPPTQPLYASTQITSEEARKLVVESSLLTNDDSSKNFNITNDITKSPVQPQQQSASKKKSRASSCPLNKTGVLDRTYEKENNTDVAAIAVPSVEQKEVKKGARIVKPVVNGVELRETQAGPKILKPEEKAAKEEQPAPIIKQKTKIVVPDFKAMHKKLEDKKESIDDYAKRQKERHQSLSAVATSTVANNARIVRNIPTLSPITKVKASHRSPSAGTTGIPKLIKVAKQQVAPATPKTPMSAAKVRKTPPTSAVRKLMSTAPTAIDHQQYTHLLQGQHLSRQLNNLTNNNLNTSSLPSSAFSRRKSFDINASLAKPLKYQPHIGKIKPIALAQQQQQQRRQSILLNKNSKADLLHDQMRLHSAQNDDRAKINQLKSRQEKRIANQMQRRGIENVDNTDN